MWKKACSIARPWIQRNQTKATRLVRCTISKTWLLLAFVGTVLQACDADDSSDRGVYDLDPAVMQTEAEPFIAHTGDGPFDSYLAMAVPYPPVRQLLQQVQARMRLQLQSRGEAHITVVTPNEYQRLKGRLSLHRINEFFSDNIQTVPFDIVCIGRAQAALETGLESTFYIVVDAPGLVVLRQHIFSRFIAAGGEPDAFDPAEYYPHITLGFTSRDLHERDGITKNSATCIANLRWLRALP